VTFLKEIRFHGRGGQGSVTAAELIAVSAINEGKYAQAFPSFGAERRGAPVMAFVRISDEYIDLREQVYSPDIVIVLDSTLIDVVNVTEGLKDEGTVIFNTKNSPKEASKLVKADKIATIDATKIALEELGVAITNTSILGAFAKVTGLIGIDSVVEAIKERFPGSIGEKNAKAAKRASKEVQLSG
jgi:2-oxoacid:acceptor oxidoreductase gamma subunit (pyruvate/2-ketoisovalerate family)